MLVQTTHYGVKYWRLNNRLHREDGPAVIFPDGSIEWWLNGNQCTFNRWLELSEVSDEEKAILKLEYM